MHNWDFEPRKVSRAAQQLLKLMADKPILVLKDINHRLFGLIEELSIVQVKNHLLWIKKIQNLIASGIAWRFNSDEEVP